MRLCAELSAVSELTRQSVAYGQGKKSIAAGATMRLKSGIQKRERASERERESAAGVNTRYIEILQWHAKPWCILHKYHE